MWRVRRGDGETRRLRGEENWGEVGGWEGEGGGGVGGWGEGGEEGGKFVFVCCDLVVGPTVSDYTGW